LGIAAVGHLALFGVLSVSVLNESNDRFKHKPIEVSLADTVALEAAAPVTSPVPPTTSLAPEVGLPDDTTPTPDVPEPEPEKPISADKPKPKPKAAVKPIKKPEPKKTEKKPKKKPVKKPQKKTAKAKGSRLSDDIVSGLTDSPSLSRANRASSDKASPAVVASLQQEVTRQLKPHWQRLAPTGADADRLNSKLVFRLNESGGLIGTPQILGTSGRTASNAPQVSLHGERAIAAIRRASPFKLPKKYYSEWKEITYDFNKRLSR